ncbi:NAD(P)-dependent dehydrogenase (short-subunit alcohol dehydrogenase family) [Litoreibacter halocynthiae]|uniref:NAD(P)-dependent dehydrogenase (Short-subunit alcohol dehydrogenase family) n=1 Tax=Litoreibacter halocynthiae TaxID=1242689 RepID=A0A4R7LHL1_9RHOB|nr:SDR family oxidoreductase [Litoreibacter halocynthiae]TDT73821.1 NAD(P)-dependent dehydrogenase (short-subunit alcohol dehydrogenase family) [Litoreibacter halocynthiae]
MDLGLKDHRVIVTAGASGIGRAIAEGFRDEGAVVTVCDIDAEALATVDGMTTAQVDVSDRDAVSRFMAQAISDMGGLDCVVNNAGIAGPTGAVEDIPPDGWDDTLTICLTSQFNTTRCAVEALKASANGSIINLSSLAGRVGFAMRSPYAAAKWGVIGFTKSLALELGPHGIRANAILPGLVAGDRQRRVLEAKAQRLGQAYEVTEAQAFSHVSIKDYVTPQQIADQCLFLASTRGRTISGQAISICGDTQKLA